MAAGGLPVAAYMTEFAAGWKARAPHCRKSVTFRRTAAQYKEQIGMKCAELLAALNDFVDGTIDPSVCEEFEKHMAGCNPCQVVVDNIRQTITLYKEGKPIELPMPFRNRLHAALRQRWKETHPAGTAK